MTSLAISDEGVVRRTCRRRRVSVCALEKPDATVPVLFRSAHDVPNTEQHGRHQTRIVVIVEELLPTRP
jgi:hypothetical protein